MHADIIRRRKEIPYYRQRIQLATEYYITIRKKSTPSYAWKHIPSKTKYLSMIFKYFRDFGKIKAINPGMSGFGGFIDVSKSDTNSHLPTQYLPQSIVRKDSETYSQIIEKIATNNIQYPVIVKPDSAEQSFGVSYIRSDQEIREYKKLGYEKYLVEEFITYPHEFGIFCSKQGDTVTLHSVVKKVKPIIQGDGIHSVQELIHTLPLTEEIKVRIQNSLKHDELSSIPKAGECPSIVRTGTSYYGITMKDIASSTPLGLTNTLQSILEDFDGFHYGRFDILSDSLEGIANGDFKIIELNGSSGIPLHIYDPEKTIQQVHDIMNNHFEIMFSIAEKNIVTYDIKPLGFIQTALFFIKKVSLQKLSGSSYKFWKVTFQIILLERYLWLQSVRYRK